MIRTLIAAIAAAVSVAQGLPTAQTTPPPLHASSDDWAVIRAVIAHLEANNRFGFTFSLKGGASRPTHVILDLACSDHAVEPRDISIPKTLVCTDLSEAVRDLILHSGSPAEWPGIVDHPRSVQVEDLSKLKPPQRMREMFLRETHQEPPRHFWFLQELGTAFPTAKTYISAYLPGYSSDRTIAIVYFGIGLSPHGGDGTYVLKRRNGKWYIKGRELSYNV